jgi:hypothetical protein
LVDAADSNHSADADGASAEGVADAPSDGTGNDGADVAPVDAATQQDAMSEQDAAELDADAAFDWPTCPAAADGGDAGRGDGGDAGGRVLEQVFAGATWNVGQSVAGLAVDAQGRVYLADANNVYVYVCGRLLIYMTAAEVAAIAGGSANAEIQDMDMAPDGSLYILLSAGIVHSTAPHKGELFQSTSNLTYPHRLGAVANNRVAVTHYGGLSEYNLAGGSLVYSASQIKSPSDCAVEDLTTDPSGVFLYNVGCNGSPLLRGNLDGSGV